MSEVLTDFIRALRQADVRVSISESIDAGKAVELVGYEDRTVLKHSLSQVLAKTEEEKEAFSATFDRYFAFDQFKPQQRAKDQDNAEPGEELMDCAELA